jgi:hypothetical protein
MTSDHSMTLAGDIEAAFGRNTYPRGVNPTHRLDWGDYVAVSRDFRSRNWWDCDAAFLKSYDGAFTFMTTEAKVYFAPAYMTAAVMHPGRADTVPDTFISNLDAELLANFTPEQRAVIRRFLESRRPRLGRNKQLEEKIALILAT